MTALKLNRFSLSEIETATIRCKQCGSGHIVKIDSAHFNVRECPSCGSPYGELAYNVFYRLQESHKAMITAKEYIDVEFDIVNSVLG
jgi:Zn finger protein HypA/HybF involved in hydrogenase expression